MTEKMPVNENRIEGEELLIERDGHTASARLIGGAVWHIIVSSNMRVISELTYTETHNADVTTEMHQAIDQYLWDPMSQA